MSIGKMIEQSDSIRDFKKIIAVDFKSPKINENAVYTIA